MHTLCDLPVLCVRSRLKTMQVRPPFCQALHEHVFHERYVMKILKTLHNPNQIGNKRNEIKNVMNLKFKKIFRAFFSRHFQKLKIPQRVRESAAPHFTAIWTKKLIPLGFFCPWNIIIKSPLHSCSAFRTWQ